MSPRTTVAAELEAAKVDSPRAADKQARKAVNRGLFGHSESSGTKCI